MIASDSDASLWPDHRPNVGVVLFDRRGLVFIGRRYATSGPWSWQFPQGGMDEGETPEQAGLRELHEETGVTADLVEPLAALPGWLVYDFPPEVLAQRTKNRWKGQKQRWFAYRFLGTDAAIDLRAVPPQEFDAFRWEALARVPGLIIPWKRAVYEQVAEAFAAFATPG